MVQYLELNSQLSSLQKILWVLNPKHVNMLSQLASSMDSTTFTNHWCDLPEFLSSLLFRVLNFSRNILVIASKISYSVIWSVMDFRKLFFWSTNSRFVQCPRFGSNAGLHDTNCACIITIKMIKRTFTNFKLVILLRVHWSASALTDTNSTRTIHVKIKQLGLRSSFI